MKAKSKSKRNIPVEVGQVVYGVWSGLAWSIGDRDYKEKPVIYKFVVSKVNSSSFYIHEANLDDGYERRVSRDDWSTKDSFGEWLNLYETEQEILDRAALVKESRELSEWLQQRIPNLTIDQKRKLKAELGG